MKSLVALLSATVALLLPLTLQGQEANGQPARPAAGAAAPQAQEANGQPARPAAAVVAPDCCAELRQKVSDLEGKVTKLEKQLGRVRTKVSKHDEDLKTIAQGVVKDGNRISALENTTQGHGQRISANEIQIQDLDSKLKDIAQVDPQTGSLVPNLLGNMQRSPMFRNEVQKATQGKLKIHNPYNSERILYVNGTPWRALVGESYIWVSYGNIQVSQSPWASPQVLNNWTYNATGQYWEVRYQF